MSKKRLVFFDEYRDVKDGFDGPYETIEDTYRRLGAWVAHHAEPAGTRVREIYTVTVGDTDDPE